MTKDISKENKLWILFTRMMAISATTNGGFAIVSMMDKEFCKKRHWLEEDEILDLTSISQSAPGPIAINASVLVGYKVAGLPGALITMLGTAIPPFVIMFLVTVFYEFVCKDPYVRSFMYGMQAGVVALLVSITIDLFVRTQKKKSILNLVLCIAAFLTAYLTDIGKLWIALFCAAAGVVKVLLLTGKEAEDELHS